MEKFSIHTNRKVIGVIYKHYSDARRRSYNRFFHFCKVTPISHISIIRCNKHFQKRYNKHNFIWNDQQQWINKVDSNMHQMLIWSSIDFLCMLSKFSCYLKETSSTLIKVILILKTPEKHSQVYRYLFWTKSYWIFKRT